MAETSSFESLPVELQKDIMSRLPLKSLMKLLCISKRLTTIIRGKEFQAVYLSRSMTRPQLMFVLTRVQLGPYKREYLLLSVYPEENPLLLSPGHPKMLLPSSCLSSQPIRGLFCLRDQDDTEVTIYNPGTNKCYKSGPLPEIPQPDETEITTYFGYDEDNDVYKVLCIIEVGEGKLPSRKSLEETFYVWTMGSDENAWRQITCAHQHSSYVQGLGLSKKGVLYYTATTNSEKSLLMSFNVGSEEFSAIELPEKVNLLSTQWELVNYDDKIALVNFWELYGEVVILPNGSLAFDLWVRNEGDGKWLSNRIEIPGWKETVLEVEDTTNSKFFFRGTTETGIRVFSTMDSYRNIDGTRGHFVVCYDPRTKDLKTFLVDGGYVVAIGVRTYLDYIDTPLLI